MTYERLKGLREAERAIREIDEELRELLSDAMPGSGFSGGGSSGQKTETSRVERLALRRIELENRLKAQKAERMREVIAVREYISRLRDPDMRKILRLRFIRGFSWVKVAEEMGRADMAEARRMQFRRWAAKNLTDWISCVGGK